MMTPSLFNDSFDLMDRPNFMDRNFMDSFYNFPWFSFDDRAFRNMEKKLYGHRAANVMNTDIRENDAGYELTVDLPGFTKDDVNLELNKGYLTISASKSYDNEEGDADTNADETTDADGRATTDDVSFKADAKSRKTDRYIRHERYEGSCSRSFYVGEDITNEDVKAQFRHGILTIEIPKKDAKQIEQKRYIQIEG